MGYDDDLEANLGALIKPSGVGLETALKLLEQAAKLLSVTDPGLFTAIQTAAFTSGLFYNLKKADRVTPVLLGFYERLQKVEAAQRAYVRKEEGQAFVEEALRRIANQPDEPRRKDMQRILYKTVEKPRDHADNRLFLRLADELPTEALKLLAALHDPIVPQRSATASDKILAVRTGMTREVVRAVAKYLSNESLMTEEPLHTRRQSYFDTLLTPLGRAFEEYRRG
jgi:hypothetical protein